MLHCFLVKNIDTAYLKSFSFLAVNNGMLNKDEMLIGVVGPDLSVLSERRQGQSVPFEIEAGSNTWSYHILFKEENTSFNKNSTVLLFPIWYTGLDGEKKYPSSTAQIALALMEDDREDRVTFALGNAHANPYLGFNFVAIKSGVENSNIIVGSTLTGEDGENNGYTLQYYDIIISDYGFVDYNMFCSRVLQIPQAECTLTFFADPEEFCEAMRKKVSEKLVTNQIFFAKTAFFQKKLKYNLFTLTSHPHEYPVE